MSNKEIIATVTRIVQELIEENGYRADLCEADRVEYGIYENGCVNYSVWCNGFEGYHPVRITVHMKYDAKPEADKGHYKPDVTMMTLIVDSVNIIEFKNEAYTGRG